MAQPLISVIMPVYNAEKYLAAALASLLGQDYANFEARLIDDGSTDGSPAILDDFAARDSRLHVTRVANGGQARARALALTQARGAYIAFMDSDDLATPRWLSALVETIGSADIAQVNYATYLAGPQARFSRPYHVTDFSVRGADTYRLWLEDKELRGYLWNKLFRTELFTPALPVAGFNLMEDAYLIGQLLPRVTQINFHDEAVYDYRLNPASTVHDKFHEADLRAIDELGALYMQVAETMPGLEALAVRKYASLSLWVLSKMTPAQLSQHWGYAEQLGAVLKDYSQDFAAELADHAALDLPQRRPHQLAVDLRQQLADWSALIGQPRHEDQFDDK